MPPSSRTYPPTAATRDSREATPLRHSESPGSNSISPSRMLCIALDCVDIRVSGTISAARRDLYEQSILDISSLLDGSCVAALSARMISPLNEASALERAFYGSGDIALFVECLYDMVTSLPLRQTPRVTHARIAASLFALPRP